MLIMIPETPPVLAGIDEDAEHPEHLISLDTENEHLSTTL